MSFGIDPKRLDLGLNFSAMDFTAVVSATQKALQEEKQAHKAVRTHSGGSVANSSVTRNATTRESGKDATVLGATTHATSDCASSLHDSHGTHRDRFDRDTTIHEVNDAAEETSQTVNSQRAEKESDDESHRLRTVRGVVNAGAVHDSRSAAVAYAQLRAENSSGTAAAAAVRYTLMDALRDCAMNENWVKAFRVYERAVQRASESRTEESAACQTRAPDNTTHTAIVAGREGEAAPPSASTACELATTKTNTVLDTKGTSSSSTSSIASSSWSVLQRVHADLMCPTADNTSAQLCEPPRAGLRRWGGGHFYLLLKTLLQADRVGEVGEVWKGMQQCGYAEHDMDARGAKALLSLLRRYGGGVSRRGAHRHTSLAPPRRGPWPSAEASPDGADSRHMSGGDTEEVVQTQEADQGTKSNADARSRSCDGANSTTRGTHAAREGVLLCMIADIAALAARRAWALDDRSRRIILTARIVQSLQHRAESTAASAPPPPSHDHDTHSSSNSGHDDTNPSMNTDTNKVLGLVHGESVAGPSGPMTPALAVEDFNTVLRSAPSPRATVELVTAMQTLELSPNENSYAGILASLHDPQYLLLTHASYEDCAAMVTRVAWPANAAEEDGRLVLHAASVCEPPTARPRDTSDADGETVSGVCEAAMSPEKARYEAMKRLRTALAVLWFNACPLRLRLAPVYTELLYLLRSPGCVRAFDAVLTEWRGSSISMRLRGGQQAEGGDVTDWTSRLARLTTPRWRCPPTGKGYELLIQRARYACEWELMWQLYEEMRALHVGGTARLYKILLDAVVRHPPAGCARVDRGGTDDMDVSRFIMQLHDDMRAHRVDVKSVDHTITLINAWSGTRHGRRWTPVG